MSNDIKNFEERMSSLVKTFCDRLPSEVHKILDLVEKIFSADTEAGFLDAGKSALQELRHASHKLSGSGATFGFPDLSKAAKALEHAADAVLEGREPFNDERKKELRDLAEQVDVEAKRRNPAKALDILARKETVVVEQWPRETKWVYTFTEDRYTPADLIDQLGFFGFVARSVSLEHIQSTLDNKEQVILIVDTRFLLEQIKYQQQLFELKEENDKLFHILFISIYDDFDTRLLAVRAGGEAFFQAPLDIGRIIDKIEDMTEKANPHPYHILIIDDDPEQVSYHALSLQNAGMITSVAINPRQVIQVLYEAKPELILMDMYMPGCSGVELAAMIRQHEAFVSIPIVYLSVETNLEKQLKAISIGADDFLTKPIKPEHLIASVTMRAERTRSMRFFMERDSLTGLLNHTNLKEQLSREVLRAHRVGRPMCFAMIDLDFFKSVNDTYGHLTGDRVLKSLARLLNERLRKTDVIGRYGGEEFGVILLNTEAENAEKTMNEIRENFSRIRQIAGEKTFHVTLSCGIACMPTFKEAVEISEAADKALYIAKESGRNRVVVAKRD